ncbi:MAG: phosphotransacetylase family protein [Cyanobacteriota bacterium]|nr:phosphotransacetylase family protein [Cyanobacteriota bacterium]
MPHTKYLLVGSTEAYSGKSATILGIAHQLKSKGIDIAYGKPLGTCATESTDDDLDADVRFLGGLLKLPPNRIAPTLLRLDAETTEKRLLDRDTTDYRASLIESYRNPEAELTVLEGPGNLEEGSLFDLSVSQLADAIDARVLLVARFHSVLLVDSLLAAARRLGDRLVGVVINDIPGNYLETARTQVQPFLEARGIPVFGLLPSSELLRSVSVGEVAHYLNADVLCCADRLDLMLEGIQIGAMSVNSAVQYFTQARNKAIVTGGDRADIQLAALETAAHCLILTGHITPPPLVLSRAEEVEIPILSVDLDTLQAVEQIERTFGQVRLHESIKVEYVRQMMGEHFDLDRLLVELGSNSTIASS